MKRTILFIASLLGITAFCQDRIAGLSTLQTVAERDSHHFAISL